MVINKLLTEFNTKIQNMIEYDTINKLPGCKMNDIKSDNGFEDIVELASLVCDTPISIISVFDNNNKQRFKAAKGIMSGSLDEGCIFCHYAVQKPKEVMVVSDARLDHRFSSEPMVTGDFNIRFYAGAPLVNKQGKVLGTLCVIDTKPRAFACRETSLLKSLAERTVNLIELKRQSILQEEEIIKKSTELKITLERLMDAQHTAGIGSWDWNLTTNELYWSPEMFNIFGIEPETTNNLFELWQSKVHSEDLNLVRKTLSDGIDKKHSNCIEYRISDKDDSTIWVETKGTVEMDNMNQVTRMSGTVQNITARKKAENDRNQYLKTLETLVFNFSHQVRRPLSNCLGIIQLIDFDHISLREAKKFASHLKKSASNFDRLVKEMSDFVCKKKESIS